MRGLDYYNRTVFEWVTDKLGAQGTVCAGGRYDGLVEQLGGHATPAVGFAMGLGGWCCWCRQSAEFEPTRVVDVYVIAAGQGVQSAALLLAEQLRDALPELKLMSNLGGGSFKKQFARADKWGARIALVIGEDEVANGQLVIKDLRTGEQQTLAQGDAATALAALLQR